MKTWVAPLGVSRDYSGRALQKLYRPLLASLIVTGAYSLVLGVMLLRFPRVCLGLLAAFLAACALLRCSRFSRTLALWWLLLSYRAFLPRLEQIDFGLRGSASLDLLAEVGILIFIGAFVVGDILPSALSIRNSRWSPLVKQCIAFVGVSFLSALIAPLPLFALASAAKLANAVALCAYAVACAKTSSDLRNYLGVTYLGLVPYMALPWFAMRFAPEFAYAPNGRLIGFWMYPVVLGIIASLVSVAAMVRFSQGGPWLRRCVYGALALCGIVTCLATASKSGFVSFLSGFAAVMFAGLGIPIRGRRVVLVVALAGVCLGLACNMIAIDYLKSWYVSDSQLETLSGRTNLWAQVLREVAENPLRLVVGHGYTAARVEGLVASDLLWYTTEAHNALLNVLYEMGVLGLGILVAIIVTAVGSGLKRLREAQDLVQSMVVGEAMAVFITLLVASFAVSLYGGMPRAEGLVFWGLVSALGWRQGVGQNIEAG